MCITNENKTFSQIALESDFFEPLYEWFFYSDTVIVEKYNIFESAKEYLLKNVCSIEKINKHKNEILLIVNKLNELERGAITTNHPTGDLSFKRLFEAQCDTLIKVKYLYPDNVDFLIEERFKEAFDF